jgi:hypothetical protein
VNCEENIGEGNLSRNIKEVAVHRTLCTERRRF